MTKAFYRIPFPPSVNAPYRHAITENGGVRRVHSKKHAKWFKHACQEIMIQRTAQAKIPVGSPYRLSLVLQRQTDFRRHDLDNLIKPVSDLLVSMTIIEDDSKAEEIHLRWGDVQGCEITLETVT